MLKISPSLKTKLEDTQRQQLSSMYPDENLRTFNAVALTYGLGPAVYLTLEGEMIIWNYDSDKALYRTTQLSDIAAYLTIGARSLDLPELLALLPSSPTPSAQCRQCNGNRWKALPNATQEVVCWECNGLGWIADADRLNRASTNNTMDQSPR